MAKLREILKRRRAVGNIRTVTRAMELVASSRFRRTHAKALASRPHTDRLVDLVNDIASRGGFENVDHPLLANIEGVMRDVLLVITSSRGLCGGYNHAILRTATERYAQIVEAGYEVHLHVVGRRGISYFRARRVEIEQTYTDFDGFPDYERVGRLAETFMAQFAAGLIGGLEVAYMQHLSTSQQKPVIAQILPLADLSQPRRRGLTTAELAEYEFSPSVETVIRNLLPATARLRVYQCFLDASVSEQVYRMRAMRSAVENADEMIQQLTIQYNRLRQGQITTELSEIIGGRIGMSTGEGA